MTAEVLEMHIGHAKAFPAHCPVCGWNTDDIPHDGTLGGMLKSHYTKPSRVYSRPVEGWKGFVTWWFQCLHKSPMDYVIGMDNHFLEMLAKPEKNIGLKYFIPIPFEVSNREPIRSRRPRRP